jgi:hypothetical protein
MPTQEPPPCEETVVEIELFPVEDLLADRIEQLTLRAENHREAAADLLRAADRAEDRAHRLRAYRFAIEAFVGDPQALDMVDRLVEDWHADGEQLVMVVREALRAVDDPPPGRRPPAEDTEARRPHGVRAGDRGTSRCPAGPQAEPPRRPFMT